MNEKRLHRCCFTGHRPEKLQESEYVMCEKLEKEIKKSINDGFNVFISGMARGFDIYAAETVLKLRNKNEDIKLICASPFDGFERNWQIEWQQRYRNIIEKADLIRYISPCYSRSCFQIRNIWMVERSVRLIAYYNGEKSGTRNTVEYARKNDIEVINIF